MKLRKSETVRVVYDNGVDIRHVDSALYDCGGEQHVEIVVAEVDYGFFKLFGGHLSVSHYGAGIRNKPLYHPLEIV